MLATYIFGGGLKILEMTRNFSVPEPIKTEKLGIYPIPRAYSWLVSVPLTTQAFNKKIMTIEYLAHKNMINIDVGEMVRSVLKLP